MKKKLIGVVASDKMDKSLRVEIERRFSHPIYGKIVRGRTVCHVHDEENAAHTGDTVEIVECRPRSKTKRWELVRIVKSPVMEGEELTPATDSVEPAVAGSGAAKSEETTETATPETAVSAGEE